MDISIGFGWICVQEALTDNVFHNNRECICLISSLWFKVFLTMEEG